MSACLSYFLVSTFFSGNVKYEELALGTQTVTYQAMDQNRLIHIQHIDSTEVNDLLSGWRERGEKDVIFFLGNSQTHSINQKKDSEVNYVELLHKENASEQREVLCVSQPNAGLQEFYTSYMYFKEIFKIREVVIPVFMDDMREDGIRADVFFSNLLDDHFQFREAENPIAMKLNTEFKSYWTGTVNPSINTNAEAASELRPDSETLQEKTENELNAWLDTHSVVWSNRQNVRGDFFNWIYKLRNTVLGIHANTIRKMIPQRYDMNMQVLRFMVEDCMKNNIKVLLYIPPIRSDVTLPYDMNEYGKFKDDVRQIAQLHPDNVLFANFESIVPAELWGYKEATNLRDDKEIDFMHFQYRGHRILADSLQTKLNALNKAK